MKSFFKIFFATTAALFFFSFLIIVLGVCTASSSVETMSPKSVLTIDLSKSYHEVGQENPLLFLQTEKVYNTPAFYEVVELIENAATDASINAIYLKGGFNMNGFANSDEIRKAILHFREVSKKPVYAYATDMDQLSYYVMSAADSIFVNPQGSVEWSGISSQILFFKGLIDKLEINPQIIYAGKFKSATEPFREKQMSEPNKLQYKTLLEDIFGYMVQQVGETRNINAVDLRKYADDGLILHPQNAVDLKLIDGLRYEDEVDAIFRNLLNISEKRKVSYESIGKYAEVNKNKINSSTDRIGLVTAQGDIVTGKGGYGSIGSEEYVAQLKKARLNSSVKAVVFRVNTGGGSALASEEIWREVSLIKQVKPIVVSMGDYAASGGYYIAANANTIVADPATLTGSIGVFTLIPSFEEFLNKKVGINVDGVATSEKAKPLSVVEDLNPYQIKVMKMKVDTIYEVFKKRVADGRNLDINYVDSIAQGRVWSGIRAKEIGLVDTLGSLTTAIKIAAKAAGISDYGMIVYPGKKNALEFSGIPFGASVKQSKEELLQETLGKDAYKIYKTVEEIQANYNIPLLKPYETFLLK